jgi:26S proteasome regulatory subunit T2
VTSHLTHGGDLRNAQKDKPKYEPPPPTTRVGRKKKRMGGGPDAANKLPTVFPNARCKLKLLRMDRIKDHLMLEDAFVTNEERYRASKGEKGGLEQRQEEERSRVDDMRGSPMGVGTLEEMIDDDHAIVSSTTGPECVH